MSTASPRNLVVNGENKAVRALTLDELIDELEMSDQRVATAVNGTFVPQTERSARTLVDGDAIEILTARQGG